MADDFNRGCEKSQLLADFLAPEAMRANLNLVSNNAVLSHKIRPYQSGTRLSVDTNKTDSMAIKLL